jgi:hypothetical protein
MFNISNSRGFAFLPFLLANWQLIALGLLIATAYGFYLHCQSIKSEYSIFKAEVKVKGEEQERKAKETIERNERVSNDRIKSLEGRLARTRAEFNRLSKRPVSSELPPVPETARAVDDTARDQQLLAVLQYAQEQTDRLIELQEWVRQQYQAR